MNRTAVGQAPAMTTLGHLHREALRYRLGTSVAGRGAVADCSRLVFLRLVGAGGLGSLPDSRSHRLREGCGGGAALEDFLADDLAAGAVAVGAVVAGAVAVAGAAHRPAALDFCAPGAGRCSPRDRPPAGSPTPGSRCSARAGRRPGTCCSAWPARAACDGRSRNWRRTAAGRICRCPNPGRGRAAATTTALPSRIRASRPSTDIKAPLPGNRRRRQPSTAARRQDYVVGSLRREAVAGRIDSVKRYSKVT